MGSAEKWVACLNRVARVALLEKLPFEQKLKGVEKISHAIIKARHSPCKA